MERIESFEHLSIACQNEDEEPTPGSAPSSSESSPMMTPETSDDEDEDLLFLPEPAGHHSSGSGQDLLDTSGPTSEQFYNEGPNWVRSAEASDSPFDDENEVSLTSPARTSESSEAVDEDSLHLPEMASASWYTEVNDLPGAPLGIRQKVEDGKEDSSQLCEVEHAILDDSGYNVLASPMSTRSNDQNEHFYDALAAPYTFYGSRLSYIREVDKATVEEIIRRTPREQTRAQTRVLRELKSIHEDETTPYLSVTPIDGNILNCLASMEGSPGTPLEDGVFWLHFQYPDTYPMKAPVITFLTPVYHPNIDENGRICIDILETSWSPCLQTQTLLLSILSVLHHPILDDALEPEIAQKYEEDYSDFCNMARLYTEESAHGVRPDTENLLNLTSDDPS